MIRRIALALAVGCLFSAACARTKADPEPPVTDPALTSAPPAPHNPPALAPHTRLEAGPVRQAPDDAAASTWAAVLYTPVAAEAAPPPVGEARDADRRLAAEDPIRYDSRVGADRRLVGSRFRSAVERDRPKSDDVGTTQLGVLGADVRRPRRRSVPMRRLGRGIWRSAGASKSPTSNSYDVLAGGWLSDITIRRRKRRSPEPQQKCSAISFRRNCTFLQQNLLAHLRSRIWMGAALPSGVEAGQAVGRAAAAAALEWARTDGIERVTGGSVRKQTDKWYSRNQTLPGFGRLRPWTLKSGDQFRSPPPPPVDSPEFGAALAEIRAFSDRLSAEQFVLAQYWNLGVGGISVPGMWDQIGLDLARAAAFSEARTARTMALLNMAMMDACIASWDTKYHYLVPRPSMRDAAIREPLGLPSHPSYTSGHSAFSGAAEGILSAIFPDAADQLHRLAEEASASRWFGGIHYRFDGDEGLRQGRAVAAWVLSSRTAKDTQLSTVQVPASSRRP